MSNLVPDLKLITKEMGASEDELSAVFLSETTSGLNDGAGFLEGLNDTQRKMLQECAQPVELKKGQGVFFQGDSHNGIYLIESGLVRTYYTGPSGKEITLAYWTHGHFVGGPEVFGGGTHVWSAEVREPCRLSFFAGKDLRDLVEKIPAFAICLIEALVAKGKCYSALVQMLGTRSVSQRLAQFLMIVGNIHGTDKDGRVILERRITHDQLAVVVGSTRQWVTQTLDRWKKNGVISISGRKIIIERPDLLTSMSDE